MAEALHRELPRIHALRTWQMARAASYPYMDETSRRQFVDEIIEMMKPAHERDIIGLTPSGKPALMFNGVPISKRALRANLAMLLPSGGYSE